eukprot:jgi/Psemu1/240805/estExt_Genewise1.C_1950031
MSRIGGNYEQNALTFTVSLEKASSMNGRAFQRYLSDGGPLALLPTYSPNHAVIVWSTSPENVWKWKKSSNEDLVSHLNDSLLEGPQRIPPLTEEAQSPHFSNTIFSNLLISTIDSAKFTFPLSCYNATTFVKGRVALVGDAAHTVHPMAGQGLNLGLGDVEVLASCIKKAHDSGMDISSFLHEYNSVRHKNVSVSLGGIHALQRLFQNHSVPLQHAKTFGINMIQNLGPLRRQLAVAAAHGVSL